MTDKQKTEIERMRRSGVSYSGIAERLGISRNTVKSYCRRCEMPAPAVALAQASDTCRECGKPIVQREKTKQRIFCCRSCREKWWAKHPDKVNKKAVYCFVCPHCKKKFTAYGNSKRKYCTHECYISARFGGSGHE